jgi:hypothetical protein
MFRQLYVRTFSECYLEYTAEIYVDHLWVFSKLSDFKQAVSFQKNNFKFSYFCEHNYYILTICLNCYSCCLVVRAPGYRSRGPGSTRFSEK